MDFSIKAFDTKNPIAAAKSGCVAVAVFENKGLSLILNVGSTLPLVNADQNRIKQILINLLGNAVKFTHSGNVTVNAQPMTILDGNVLNTGPMPPAQLNVPDGRWLIVSVSDTGMGMSREDSARVFKRFFRTESAQRASISGAGLGLSITKMIVEGHGGTISCESGKGKGSTFTVTLPADGPPPSF